MEQRRRGKPLPKLWRFISGPLVAHEADRDTDVARRRRQTFDPGRPRSPEVRGVSSFLAVNSLPIDRRFASRPGASSQPSAPRANVRSRRNQHVPCIEHSLSLDIGNICHRTCAGPAGVLWQYALRRAGQGVVVRVVCCPSAAGHARQKFCLVYSIECVHCVLSARETGVIDARRRVEKRDGRERRGPAPRTPLAKACADAYALHFACSVGRQATTTGLCIQVPCSPSCNVQLYLPKPAAASAAFAMQTHTRA